jgi:hypothetical protein
MTPERLAELLEKAVCALADIATADDMTRDQMQSKAHRIYSEIRAEWEDP